MFTYTGISTRGPYAGLGFRHHRKVRHHSRPAATNVVASAARYANAKRNLDAANARLAHIQATTVPETYTYAGRQRALAILKAKNA